MSKKRIDETMTQARQAKAKKAREKADAKPTVAEYLANEGHPDAAAVATQHAADAATPPEPADTKTRRLAVVPDAAPVAPTDGPMSEPTEDLVVFAFRLTPEERNAIHKAAGAGKASKFVRALATHAARGDVKTVTEMVEAVRTGATQ